MVSKGNPERGTSYPAAGAPDDPEDVIRAAYRSGSTSHRLLDLGRSMVHEWSSLIEGEEVPVLTLKGPELLRATLHEIEMMGAGAIDSSELCYQKFAGWDDKVLTELDDNDIRIGLIRENGDRRIRITSAGIRYEMQYLMRPWDDPTPVYMVSRLNSVDYPNVVDQLGIGYWSLDGGNIPWLSLIRYPDGLRSGHSPFLTELNGLLQRALKMDGGDLRNFLRKESRVRGGLSLEASRAIGNAIGRLHGSLILDGPSSGTGRRRDEGARISDLFSRSMFDMEDIGSHLGMFSGYMEDVRKGLYRKLGDDVPPVVTSQGRKQKVVKRSGKETRSEFPTLSLLRGALFKKQERMRSRFAAIRKMKGAPMVPSGLDPGLDRIMMDDDGNPLFRKFDWRFFDIEERSPPKTLPLKDLSLVLGSLVKTRYLAARKTFSDLTGSRSNELLEMMFLDYNISKDGYLSMVSDLNAVSLSPRRDAPFRYVVITSVVSSLWFERCRNSLIQGYNEALSGTDREDLLVYPKGLDTLEGIRIMQMITSLSSATEKLHKDDGSLVSLETDLLSALSV